MIPEIDYIRPQSVQQALEILAEGQGKARLIAGGTDILPGFHINSRRFKDIKVLVDISQLPELTTIELQNNELHVGGAVTFSSIVRDSIINEHFPLLAEAAVQIGSVQIRNRATLAGNFVNNAPCADSVPPLLVYDAQVRVQSLQGERRLPLEEFLLRPYTTQLSPDEIVREVILPLPSKELKGQFYKLGRRRGVSISRITFAVLLKTERQTFAELRVASGAVTPIGKRFRALEQQALGQPTDPTFLKRLASLLGEQVLEITGLRWSSAYKLPVLQQTFYGILHALTQQS